MIKSGNREFEFYFGYDNKFRKKIGKEKKKYSSICDDFNIFKKALITDIRNNNFDVPINNKKYFRIQGLSKNVFFTCFCCQKISL